MTAPAPPTPRKLALSTLAALLVAGVVLVVAVLPAEYGVDPTGVGTRLGLTRLADPGPTPVAEAAPPPARVESYAWGGRWTLGEEEVGNWSGRLGGASTQESIRVPLNVTNLTRLTARLAWTDDVPASGPDTLEVSIRGKGRETDLVQGRDGHANATLQWRSIPYPAEENGTLRLDLAPDASSFGEWRLVVRLYGTGATPEAPDDGNGWTLRLFAESYRLETSVDEGRGAYDRVTLTIPPGRGVEYKFAMEEGARMTYRWNATAPLHSDLHADHFDDEENVTSARIAVLAGDEGTYAAPFHGRHGWYWRNDGEAPVTVTLETRGAYAILGVP